jgi:transposase InsO family protein
MPSSRMVGICPSLSGVLKQTYRISLDILGPVTRTHTGNRYILVVTDYFTRFAEACGLSDIETPTVADKLLTEFICRYGLPLQIRTDQGAQFTSDLFVQLCKSNRQVQTVPIKYSLCPG